MAGERLRRRGGGTTVSMEPARRRRQGRWLLLALWVVVAPVLLALPVSLSPILPAAAAGTPPSLTSISPETGPTTGGTTVTVNGANFVVGGTTVWLGNTQATNVTVNAGGTQLTAVTPVAAAGLASLSVSTDAGATGSSTASQYLYVAPGAYTALSTATRICDTRTGNSTLCSGHAVGANATLNVQVTGQGGVPSSAASVVLNITTVNESALGWIVAFPKGVAQPPGSTLNFVAGQSIANMVEVPIGTSGQVSVYQANASLDVIIDVEGYTLPASGTGGGFQTLTPTRICDTHTGNSTPCSGHTLSAPTPLTVQVTGAGGVPTSGVAAVVANLTVSGSSATSWLLGYATGATLPNPTPSMVNYVTGQFIADRAIIPVSASGQISLRNGSGTVDVVVDVTGYISTSGVSTPIGLFNPVNATRACDTRTASGCTQGPLTAGSTMTVHLAGVGGIPASAGASTSVAINVTVTAGTGSGWVVVYPDGTAQPPTSDVNYTTQAYANLTALVALGSDGSVAIHNQLANAQILVDILGYYAPSSAPAAPTGVAGTTASGRSLVSWSAPANGGTPITSYTVTPFIGTQGQAATSVTAHAPGGAVVTSATVAGLSNGTTYTFQVTATNGIGTGPAGVSAAVVPSPPAPITERPASAYSNGSTLTNLTLVPDANGGYDALTADGSTNRSVSLLGANPGGYSDGTYTQPASVYAANSGGSTYGVEAIAAADFNADGHLDVAVATGSSTVGIMLWNSATQSLGPISSTYTIARGKAVYAVVADVNMDGRPDIIVSEDDSGAVSSVQFGIYVLINMGGGTFQPLGTDFAPNLGQNLGNSYTPTGLAVGDLNGDGTPDAVVLAMNGSNGYYFTFLNQAGRSFAIPDGQMVASHKVTFIATQGAHQGEGAVLVDANGDSFPDLVVGDNTTVPSGIEVFVNQGDGTFSAGTVYSDPAILQGSQVMAVTWGDFNGDGLRDIVTTENAATSGNVPGISVYVSNGDGTFASPVFIQTSQAAQTVAVSDLNGDGEDDVVLGNTLVGAGSNNVSLLLNGTDFPPLGGPLSAREDRGFCASCAARRAAERQQWGAWPIGLPWGTFWHTFSDVAVPARGYPLQVTQTYNSADAATDAGLGYGWSSNLFAKLVQSGASATVTEEDGSRAQFIQSGSTWTPFAPRLEATLVHNGDQTWTFSRSGGTDVLTFSSSGQLTQERDLDGNLLLIAYNGNTWTLSHDDAGHSDTRSLAITWTGTSPNHVQQAVDNNAGLNRKVAFTYDAAGQLTDIDWTTGGLSATDQNEHFEYETATPLSHRLTGMRDPRGYWVTQAYDSSGRVTAQTVDPTAKNPAGVNRQTTYDYSVANQVTIHDNATPQQTTVDIYAYGTLVQRTAGTSAPATWHYAYDRASLGTTTTIDPDGHSWVASYDSYGNQVRAADPLLQHTVTQYSTADAPFHQPTSVTDALGTATSYTYNTKRHLTQASRPLVEQPGTTLSLNYQYTSATHTDDLTAMVDGDGKAWSYGYDGNGDRNSVTDPLGDQSTTGYNGDGWPTSAVSPKGNVAGCSCASQYTTTYGYLDGSGNSGFWGDATLITDPLGHQVHRSYDANRNLTSSVDPDGNSTQYVYDGADDTTTVQRPGGTSLVTDYNNDGTVADQKDGSGTVTQSYTYDDLKRALTTTVDPGTSPHLNQTTSFGYDPAGNLLSRQDPGGNCLTPAECTRYGYDAANRRTSITYYSSRTSTPGVSFSYDADNQLRSEAYGSSSSSWTWDSLHRLTQSTSTAGGTVAYSYNLRGEVTGLTYPRSAGTVAKAYDDAGRLHTVTDWLTPANVTTLTYDVNSNLTQIAFPNSTSGQAVSDAYTYDAADRLVNPTAGQPAISFTANGTTYGTMTYSRDANGQVSNDAATGLPGTALGSTTYTPLNQLSQVQGSPAYSYDNADNPTLLAGGTHQGFNTGNELCWSSTSTGTGCTAPTGATTYAYDAEGDRLSRTTPSGSTTYGYDQEHRLCWMVISASAQTSCASPPTGASTYTYDGDGLRASKSTGGVTTSYSWDVSGGLPLLLQETTSSSTNYVYGPGGLPLEQITGTTALFYHHDQIGSTRALTDAAGTVQASYTYDAYGNLTGSTGTAQTPLRFTGQYRDGEDGMYYLRARYYDPATAQFLSRDRLASVTRSPYSYAFENPLTLRDPSGLDSHWEDEAGQFQKLGSNAFANKIARRYGYASAEEMKRQTAEIGPGRGGQYDLYRDDNGDIFVASKEAAKAGCPYETREYVLAQDGSVANVRGPDANGALSNGEEGSIGEPNVGGGTPGGEGGPTSGESNVGGVGTGEVWGTTDGIGGGGARDDDL